MTGWLLETLAWTAVLIAAVLVLRRPVARWFGPQTAYALWAIPALRLFLPPIELPAWMRPAASLPEIAPASAARVLDETSLLNLDPAIPTANPNGTTGTEAAVSEMSKPITPGTGFEFGSFIEPMIQLALAVWLIGAAIFLYMRFAAYFRLRADLLETGNDVGRDGKVRLVETSGTDAPLAFGVIDKVIALPRGFLAQPDQTARDLALAHEMQHHRGRDLLINVLVQPLFAIHWFNPLCRYGWLALRRDQEAACDARVIAAKPAKEREAYAHLIVSTAARSTAVPALSPNLVLAAPMACPVLGEKSIIHRLRSLNMTDTSHKRRLAGRLMLGAAIVAVPMTASISYAASDVTTRFAAPAAPATPSAPRAIVAPPAAPAAPETPAAPAVTAMASDGAITSVDPDTGEADEGEDLRTFRVLRQFNSNQDEQGTERRFERQVRHIRISEDSDLRILNGDESVSEEELEEALAGMREGLAEANRVLAELPMIIDEAIASSEGGESGTVVIRGCSDTSDDVATTTDNADGTRTIMLCQSRVMAVALDGLREARDEIAEARELSAQTRERVVRELDSQISSWERVQS